MKKRVVIAFFVFVLVVFLIGAAYAKSGCCSGHAGVCNNTCCDGTALSTDCINSTNDTNNNASNASNVSDLSNLIYENTTLNSSQNSDSQLSDTNNTNTSINYSTIMVCEESNLSDYYCNNDQVYQNWSAVDCSGNSKLIENCSYGCLDGKCNLKVSEPSNEYTFLIVVLVLVVVFVSIVFLILYFVRRR